VARGQAGPPPPLVVGVAASVTPCRHPAGATVLDEYRHAGARGPPPALAAMLWAPTRSRCPGTCNAGSEPRGPWVWGPAVGRPGRWRRCPARPPAEPRSLPVRPCPGAPAAGGCGATTATGGGAPTRVLVVMPVGSPTTRVPTLRCWMAKATTCLAAWCWLGGRGGDAAPRPAAGGPDNGANAATHAAPASARAWRP
jgi:hypothetical protein